MDDLLNWLLQGGLVVLVSSVMLRLVHPSRTRARYAALWIGLGCVLLLPAVPSIWSVTSPPHSSGAMTSAAVPIVSIPGRWWTSNTFVLVLMALWSAAYTIRVVRALMAVQGATRAGAALPPEVETHLRCWNQLRARGRPTRLVLSDSVRSAAVLGCGSPPLIAIAPELVVRLTEDDLDRVVIHEWAHVQRRDDYANVASLLVRIAAGWHPAVWWFNRQLHLEREVACDEMAVAATGSAKGYAACLATLASLPTRARPACPAVAAVSSSGLRRRIVRILSLGRVSPPRSWRAVAAGAGVLLSAIALAVGGLRFVGIDVSAAARIVPHLVSAQVSSVSAALLPGRGASSVSSSEAVSARFRAPARGPRATTRHDADRPVLLDADPPTSPALIARPPSGESPGLADQSSEWAALPAVTARSTVPPAGTAVGEVSGPPHAGRDANPTSPWATAADAGVAVGRGSQRAALATAGFFARFGKRVAGSF